MKKARTAYTCIALALGIASSVFAEKRNIPKDRAVETALKKAGPGHNIEDMRISRIGSLEVGETYYHAFRGTKRKEDNFRLIFFDNNAKYLGYYETIFEPVEYEKSTIKFNSGIYDGAGNPQFYSVTFQEGGPADRIKIGTTPIAFVKAPEKKEESTQAVATVGIGGVVPEYREWKITRQGMQFTVRAIFVKVEAGKVIIMDEKRGRKTGIKPQELSEEDQEYVKQFTGK